MDQPADRPTRVKKKDRKGVWISVGAHIAVIGIVIYVATQTKFGQQLVENIMGASRDKKAQQERPKPPPAQKSTGPRRQALDAPPPSGGARRAADAPAAVG